MKLIRALPVAALLLSSSAFAVTGGPFSLGSTGCKDKDVMARALQLLDQGDIQAVRELLRRGFKSGDCRTLRMGAVVTETPAPLSRLARARIWGSPDVYWVIH